MPASSPSFSSEEAPQAGLFARAFYRFLRFLAKLLGFGGIRRAAHGMGFLFWTCLPQRRRLAVSSVSKHLEIPSPEAETIAKESFKHNAASFMECVFTPDFSFEHPLLRVENPDLLKRLKTEKRPIVNATAHFGAWELLASLIGGISSDRPRITVTRRYKNAVLDYVVTRLRSSRGTRIIGHREVAFPVLRALRRNGYVAFLVDHNASQSEAVFLPFLGEEAAVNKGPALLAVRANALLWPVFLLREDGRYVLCMEEPLDTTELEGGTDEKIEAAALFYTQAVERIVRRAPEQWFWMHDRWKTRRP